MEGFFAIGGAIPREAARSEERERDLRGLQQLMALKNPSPSTVPVPIAVPKVIGVFFDHFFLIRLVSNNSAY